MCVVPERERGGVAGDTRDRGRERRESDGNRRIGRMDLRVRPPREQTGSEAHPTPGSEAHPAEDAVPGMADGSQLPPDLLQAIDTLMQGKLKRRTPGGRGEGHGGAHAR